MAIDGAKDRQIFLAVAHDGAILHDATVSTDGHFSCDRFSIEGVGIDLHDISDVSGTQGLHRFDLIGKTAPSGSQICGEGFIKGDSLGRACVTF